MREDALSRGLADVAHVRGRRAACSALTRKLRNSFVRTPRASHRKVPAEGRSSGLRTRCNQWRRREHKPRISQADSGDAVWLGGRAVAESLSGRRRVVPSPQRRCRGGPSLGPRSGVRRGSSRAGRRRCGRAAPPCRPAPAHVPAATSRLRVAARVGPGPGRPGPTTPRRSDATSTRAAPSSAASPAECGRRCPLDAAVGNHRVHGAPAAGGDDRRGFPFLGS